MLKSLESSLKVKGDRQLHPLERLMLRLLQHLVLVMVHNALPLRSLITEPGKYFWERMGLALNTSLSLLNHNCDPNAFVFHLEKQALLVASTHIRPGEDIHIAYVPSFLDLPVAQGWKFISCGHVKSCVNVCCSGF